jgi:hypothetical protein
MKYNNQTIKTSLESDIAVVSNLINDKWKQGRKYFYQTIKHKHNQGIYARRAEITKHFSALGVKVVIKKESGILAVFCTNRLIEV